MTVCIAAIYNNSTILGVSDRMVTAGDIQFEPPSPKISTISNSIALMTAGDANLQLQIVGRILPFTNARIDANPQKWLPVGDVVELYKQEYLKIRQERAEQQVLARYKLTFDEFISKQHMMDAEFINRVTHELLAFNIENVEAIITGIDDGGAHIFVVRNDTSFCWDKIGFAAIGIGSNHANSHFMLSDYAPSTAESKALLTIHQAKKKAEASPGVGEQTDLFTIGPNPGTYAKINPLPNLDIVGKLDTFYKAYQKGITKLDKVAEERITSFLKQSVQAPPQTQEANPSATTDDNKSNKPKETGHLPDDQKKKAPKHTKK